ncbi:tRNA lysidine(34) synthetase TilS [Robiginitomaculum antarcticum]|uniref:tRNA lysidine(34) synthetase TilS n=1 Tax=Robiginitomaculum antarcticum TaxID=437507 RepID=UPI00037158DE|nr:tRNA lysidine(34) synthetase TilS [Robiginitomaculum antarcticum]
MTEAAQAVFATWLRQTYPNPAESIAVAFSGGGDSLALLILTLRHAGPRPVYALCVDHALQEGSAKIIAAAAAQAQRLGAVAQTFYWHHGTITSGVQEAARKARYGLMGDFCRENRMDSLLVAHSRDDQAETLWMRKQCGGGWRAMAGMSASSYAPVWPQLRGVTLRRPLLEWGREDIRAICRDAGEPWYDDPANENNDYLRVQARMALASDPVLSPVLLEEGRKMRARRDGEARGVQDWLTEIDIVDGGGTHVDQAALHNMSAPALARVLMCISGHPHMADMARVRALIDAMVEPGYNVQTLGGCAILRQDKGFIIARETGRWLAQNKPVKLPAHEPVVFDGRWEIVVARKGLHAAPLWPARGQLSKPQRAQLHSYNAHIRRGLVGVFEGRDMVATPFIPNGDVTYRNLVKSRLLKHSAKLGAAPA